MDEQEAKHTALENYLGEWKCRVEEWLNKMMAASDTNVEQMQAWARAALNGEHAPGSEQKAEE